MAALLGATALSPAWAGNITWQGANGGSFTTSGNWEGSVVPGAGDTAVFNTGNGAAISSSVSVLGFDVGTATSFTVAPSTGPLTFLGGGLTGAGRASIDAGNLATVTFQNASSASNAALTGAGSFVFTDDSTAGAATTVNLAFSGNVTLTGNARTITLGQINSPNGLATVDPGIGLVVGSTNLSSSFRTVLNGTLTVQGSADNMIRNSTGSGALLLQGTGTTNINVSTLSGPVTLSSGTASLFFTTLSGLVTNDAALVSTGGSTISGNIVGSGSLEVKGGNDTVLTGTNNYTGGTTITSGNLVLGAHTTTGSITGDILNNGGLITKRSDTFTLSNKISGSGSFSAQGVGTTILTADNTYTGTTSVFAGTLQVGTGDTFGSIGSGAIVIGGNGNLVIKRSDTVKLDQAIDSVGQFDQQGTGTTILTANGTGGGRYVVSAGTLQIGNGGTTGGIGSGYYWVKRHGPIGGTEPVATRRNSRCA